MVAQGRTLSLLFASSDTELRSRHEILARRVNEHQACKIGGTNGPFMQLLQLAIVEHAGEDQATDGIT